MSRSQKKFTSWAITQVPSEVKGMGFRTASKLVSMDL